MSEGVSRAKAVLPVDPNSSQGREKVGMPPALLARPTGLENDSVPREQTFELPFVLLSGEQRFTPPPSWRQPRTSRCLPTPPARQACELHRALGCKQTPGSLGGKGVFSSHVWLSHIPGKPPTSTYGQRSQERGAMQAHTFVSCTGMLRSRTPRVSLPCTGGPGHAAASCPQAAWFSHLHWSPQVIALSSGICPLSTMLSSFLQCSSSFINNQNPSQLHTGGIFSLFHQYRKRISYDVSWQGVSQAARQAGCERAAGARESITGAARGAVIPLHAVFMRLRLGNRVLLWPHWHRRHLDDR